MTRFLLWTLGGVFLGLIIHLVVILNLPRFASNGLYDQVAAITEPAEIKVLDPVAAGSDNPLGLDPAFVTGICRLDLADGAGAVMGLLPDQFWSVAVFDIHGVAIFSTTHRAASENTLNLGIFNPTQTRFLAEREIASQEDLLVVESPGNEVFVTIRLAPPHAALLPAYRTAFDALICTNLADPTIEPEVPFVPGQPVQDTRPQ